MRPPRGTILCTKHRYGVLLAVADAVGIAYFLEAGPRDASDVRTRRNDRRPASNHPRDDERQSGRRVVTGQSGDQVGSEG